MKVILREFVWTSVFLLKRLIKHGHYFHVISCRINKYIHNSLFSLDSDIPKLNTVKDSPEKTLRKNLTTTPFSYINDASVDLNLSLPESVLDRVLWGEYTFWVCGRNPMMWLYKCKLSTCTLTHVDICFSEFEKMKLWHLVEICFWLNLAVKTLNDDCLHITYLFLKELATLSDVFFLALLSHQNFHSLPEVVWRVFSPETTPLYDLVIQQSPLPQ